MSFSQFPKFKFNVIFCNFQKFWNRTISKISENVQKTLFLNVRKTLFPKFSELFQTFSKLFVPKTGFFDSKTQTLRSFFEIFKIDIQFWLISKLLISKLFSKLKFSNFFLIIFAKISRVQKFMFFSEKFPNFDSRTFLKLAKTKSLESSV